MRGNTKQAAAIGTRWIPGLKLDVAETAMQYNIQQVDRRISANDYRALWSAQDRLSVNRPAPDISIGAENDPRIASSKMLPEN